MNRETYIKSVIDFMIDATKEGNVNCLELRNKVITQFPEYELVFSRHPFHKYMEPTASKEYADRERTTLYNYESVKNKPDGNKILNEFVKARYKEQRDRLQKSFLSYFTLKTVKSTDNIFDDELCNTLDRMKVTKICVNENLDKLEPVYDRHNRDVSLTMIELLMDVMLYYKKMYIKVTPSNKYYDHENRFNIIIYSMINNTRILEADVETMQFIERFINRVSTPELFKVVFDYPFEPHEYETLGKLNTSTYAHEALDMLFKFSEIIVEDKEKFEMIKSLSGLGKTSFKNRLTYLALKCIKRPFPDIDERAKLRSVRSDSYKTNPPYDLYDKLIKFDDKTRKTLYYSYEMIDTAIAVLEKRCNKK